MGKALPPAAFQAPDTVALARGLLGHVLACRQSDGSVTRRRIVEVEAYHGFEDRASHASRGLTPRNAPMFSAGGIWYVYLCYGVHEMLNLVTGPHNFPAAILLRGVEGVSGPGRLTRTLGIDRRFNALSATGKCGLWIEDGGGLPQRHHILAIPRVGVSFAGPLWADMPWRFILTPDPEVAREPHRQPRQPGLRQRSSRV